MSDKKMTTKCKVCNEPAAGFHFGAFTCEGCKSFFGRTYTNRNNIQPCKSGGKCEINKNTRTACKHCRLTKCEKVGMSKSGSRYGRRSNWFKIAHFLEGQREQANQNDPEAPSTSGLNNHSLSNGVLNGDARDIPSTSRENPAIERPFHASLLQENKVGHFENMTSHDRYGHNRRLRREELRRLNFKSSLARSEVASSSSEQPQQRSPAATISSILAPRDIHISTYASDTLRWNLESLSRHNLNGSRNGSDRESNGEDRLHDVECRSNSSRASSSRASERESPNIRMSASRIFIPTNNSPPPILLCSPPGMTSVTAYSARGGDLLLASPNPGGLADTYEPIDLSTRANGSSSQSRNSLEKDKKKKKYKEGQKNNHDSAMEETAANPLDLTFPAGASLTRR